MRRTVLALGAVVVLVPKGISAQTEAVALEGAWRVVEVVSSGPGGTRTLGEPQPGPFLFTGGHYSYTLVNGDQPRPRPPGGFATAEQLLAAWNPFAANAGTFEVEGNRMIRRPIVAKSPDAMGPGIFNEYTFRLSADTLWITTVGTESGPARAPTTVRYVRAR
jgi:hypothetical protein